MGVLMGEEDREEEKYPYMEIFLPLSATIFKHTCLINELVKFSCSQSTNRKRELHLSREEFWD
jgi:hypothetical protein